jgi:hypothetical protein
MKTHSSRKLALVVASLGWVIAIPTGFAQSQPPELVTNGPQTSPGDGSGNGAVRRNVADSQRYEQTLHANTAFRDQRQRKECGSIDDAKLHEQCVASFH